MASKSQLRAARLFEVDTLIDCRPLTQRERAEYAAEVAGMEA